MAIQYEGEGGEEKLLRKDEGGDEKMARKDRGGRRKKKQKENMRGEVGGKKRAKKR